jgi:RNA polymerase sigma-70 factor (ECF subfamily)
MDIRQIKVELEKLHGASFGWAMACCSYNHAQAEDVLQMVYLKILEGKAVYGGKSNFRTWLFAVIRKTAIGERRKAIVRALASVVTVDEVAIRRSCELESTAKIERSELQSRFRKALDRLPARQRETLHLVFYEDLSLREAAVVMNVSIGSVRRHYERGKKSLRQILDGEDSGYEISWGRTENSGALL